MLTAMNGVNTGNRIEKLTPTVLLSEAELYDKQNNECMRAFRQYIILNLSQLPPTVHGERNHGLLLKSDLPT